jgi:REP element-mobilizing transposase RayT
MPMAQTLVSQLMHVVFSTKHRSPLIRPEIEPALFPYLGGIARQFGSRCLAVNGTEDHVHLLVSLAKTIALSDLVREIKKGSSAWMREKWATPQRFRWQEGYGAFSVSRSNVPAVERYIASQKAHHRRVSFEDEYLALLTKNGVEFDERYLWA